MFTFWNKLKITPRNKAILKIAKTTPPNLFNQPKNNVLAILESTFASKRIPTITKIKIITNAVTLAVLLSPSKEENFTAM